MPCGYIRDILHEISQSGVHALAQCLAHFIKRLFCHDLTPFVKVLAAIGLIPPVEAQFTSSAAAVALRRIKCVDYCLRQCIAVLDQRAHTDARAAVDRGCAAQRVAGVEAAGGQPG
jgi:hypothetical protein